MTAPMAVLALQAPSGNPLSCVSIVTGTVPVNCPLSNPVTSVGGAIAGGAVSQLASALAQGEAKIVRSMTTLLFSVPTGSGNLSAPTAPPAVIWQYTQWYVAALAVAGLLIAAGRLAWERRAEPARTAAAGMVTLALVTSLTASAVELALKAGVLPCLIA